jgi:predicted amidohydrolase YtcJ
MKMNALLLALLASLATVAHAQEPSLQELSRNIAPLPHVTIYTAKEIVTLNEMQPKATAVAVVGDRILAVGSLEDLKLKPRAGDQPYTIDETFAGKVLVPGFIAQHDHPFLASLTMKSEIIAIEDWVLPSGTVPAAKDREDYLRLLSAAEKKLGNPDELLLTWGYHHYFHGPPPLTRADLDRISATRPIIVWHRSCHEFILNSAAIQKYGVTQEHIAQQSASAQAQSDLTNGHFWEQGLFGVLGLLAPAVATPERVKRGLEFTESYFHFNGITLACEPGGVLSRPVQDAENAVLGDAATPFRFYFIPDGKSLIALYPDPHCMIAETEKLLSWGEGMTAFLPRQVKLFADGAIFSQLMQMKGGYTDGHHGEWMMEPDVFAKAFRAYWDAGYQLHVHVNGDAGLDLVLATLEDNMRRHPRFDHRTVLVHFGFSTAGQVKRIAALGAIVSANPYYTTALADKYGVQGIGVERSDQMVRLGDVERAGISYSFHSDMPMAPAQPLYLMHCAVNRTTVSGRVAGPDQVVSRLGALKAVTLNAAYSLQLEKEVGSIEPGKRANFTVLSDNPVTVDSSKLKNIQVWGTVHEGRVLPVRAE